MLKIDLAKAFDRIEWSFILDAMQRRGFHSHSSSLCMPTSHPQVFQLMSMGNRMETFWLLEDFGRDVLYYLTCLSLLLMNYL